MNRLPYQTAANAASAFSDLFNWFMIIPFAGLAALLGVLAIRSYSWISFAGLCVIICLLCGYIWAILWKEITISEEGIRYREGPRRLFFKWDEVDEIILEPNLGQITFGQNGKRKRIHEFGLPKRERLVMREILLQEATARALEVVVSPRGV